MSTAKWQTPFDDLPIADMAASEDMLVVAGATSNVEVEVRTAQWDGTRFVELSRIAVPHEADCGEIRPWLSVDRRGDRTSLAINLEEYQGGSWGVVVIPDLANDGRELIENATHETDMAFAAPLLLRGDTLLARGPFELRCFVRTAPGRWTERLVLPAGDDSSIEWSWTIDLSPDGNTWMAGRSGDGARLVILERRGDSFAIATELPMDDEPSTIAFLSNDEALVGSAAPWSDGSSLRFARRTAHGWTWGRTLAVPREPNGWAVSQVAVHSGLALVTQQDAALLMDLESGESVPLSLPDAEGSASRDPQVRVMGSHAVVRVANRLRVFDLNA